MTTFRKCFVVQCFCLAYFDQPLSLWRNEWVQYTMYSQTREFLDTEILTLALPSSPYVSQACF